MPKTTHSRYEENFPGSNLSADEAEFACAMERYMRLQRRPFPTWHEVLAVAHALGYRKITPQPEVPREPDGLKHSE